MPTRQASQCSDVINSWESTCTYTTGGENTTCENFHGLCWEQKSDLWEKKSEPVECHYLPVRTREPAKEEVREHAVPLHIFLWRRKFLKETHYEAEVTESLNFLVKYELTWFSFPLWNRSEGTWRRGRKMEPRVVAWPKWNGLEAWKLYNKLYKDWSINICKYGLTLKANTKKH